ncbi:MAG: tail fiber domain-containing protein [Acidobacteria bacterium]|nr:tail fiber domain-containing protein [Acidobacteriota bacterium]
MIRLITISFFIALLVSAAYPQTTGFTFQGRLNDTAAPANGPYDFTFRLYDNSAGGAQIGSDIVLNDVNVVNGIFTVSLDFGSPAFANGLPRFLEIAVRNGPSTGAFTLLNPRQPVSSAPYAIKSLNAASADTSTNAMQLGGTAANQFVQTTDSRLSDDRNPLPNSVNYIQNGTTQQSSSNFNVSGTGTANIFNAATQYNLGGSRALFIDSVQNTFVGRSAGGAITTGTGNNFFGYQAGIQTTTGSNNTFLGYQTGLSNTTGLSNIFVGLQAGRSNTTGLQNVFIGDSAGYDNTIGIQNVLIGTFTGRQNTSGQYNNFIGFFAGHNNTTGQENSFFGANAGQSNTGGYLNTAIGSNSDILGATDLSNATAIGAFAAVTQSNSVVIGSINGINSCSPTFCDSAKVAIGTTAPTFRFHVKAGNQDGIKIQNGGGDFQQIRWTNSSDVTTALISVGPTGSEDMRFYVNGADRMIVENTGTVVINTLGSAGATALCRNASNQIATCSSSLRYKTNINDFRPGLSLIKQLRPITFNWREGGAADLGLGAEDVAEVDELLVTKNEKGEVEGVKYDRVGVVLVNAVKEQQTEIEEQQKRIEAEAERNAALEKQIEEQNRVIKAQQAELDAMKTLLCAQNPGAAFCKPPARQP